MGNYRYEVKRGLYKTPIEADAAEGTIGFILKGFDISKFNGAALFENWEGVVVGGDFYAAAINTNLYHNNGANWKAASNTAIDDSAVIVANYLNINTGTASGNATAVAAAKPFYANRNDTWGGDAKGLVFEALVNLCSDSGAVFDAFIGLVNSATPQAVTDALESGAQTSAVKRIGFGHHAAGTSNTVMTIAANGSSQVSIGTTTVTNLGALATTSHYKFVYNFESRDAKFDSLGTSVGPSIDFYIDDTMVSSVTNETYMLSGEVPIYPYFYIEAQQAEDVGLNQKIYGLNCYYI